MARPGSNLPPIAAPLLSQAAVVAQVNDQPRRTNQRGKPQQENELFAIHRAEFLLRLAAAMKTPAKATPSGMARIFNHSNRVSKDVTCRCKSFWA